MAEFAEWPVGLPNPLVDGAGLQPMDNVVRSQMDAGTPKVRRRFTNVGYDVNYALALNRAQVQILDDFVEITLKDVMPFKWHDFRRPITEDNVAVYRFKRRPRYAPRTNGNRWQAELELELLTPIQASFLLNIEDDDGYLGT